MIKRLLAALLAFLAMSAFAAVDVNKASAAELDAVKGIGPVIAGKITAERAKGQFKDWPDLINRVSGIGEKSAAKLSENGLTVNGSSFSGAPAAAPAKATAKATTAAPAAAPTTSPGAAPAAPAATPPAAETKQTKKEAAEAKATAKAEAKAKAKADKEQAATDKAAAAKDKKDKKAAAAAAAASAAKK